MTSGNHLTRRPKTACDEPRDRNRWNVYCREPLRLFLLRWDIELLHAFVRQNVHPLTAATFGDWLSPRAQADYHKSRTIGVTFVWSKLRHYVIPENPRKGSGVFPSPTYIYLKLWRHRKPTRTHACCQPTLSHVSDSCQSSFGPTKAWTLSDAYTHIHMYSLNVSFS